jgi:hypothetical protein
MQAMHQRIHVIDVAILGSNFLIIADIVALRALAYSPT